MEFPCSSCGLCCRNIKSIIESSPVEKDDPMYFPYEWDENGACEMLDGNLCSIYEDRPLVCSAEKVADHLEIPREDFYPRLVTVCNTWMDEEGVDEKFRINSKPK